MPAWLHPRRDERAANAFLDLASAVDAGLAPQYFGADPADGDALLVRALQRRGIALDALEATVLQAAWTAGIGPAVLRRRAEEREQRAAFGRSVLTGLRYPLVLLALCTLVSFVARALGAWWLAWVVVGIDLLLAAIVLWLVRMAKSSSPRALDLPGIGPLVRDMAELPYLEVLHGLYGAGVPLREAHARAVAAAPPSPLQERLRLADRHVQDGRPVHEALAQTLAVDGETLHLLATGERTGGLEEALHRAIRRRRDTALRRSTALAKGVANGTYALAVVLVVLVVFQFYASYYGALSKLR